MQKGAPRVFTCTAPHHCHGVSEEEEEEEPAQEVEEEETIFLNSSFLLFFFFFKSSPVEGIVWTSFGLFLVCVLQRNKCK